LLAAHGGPAIAARPLRQRAVAAPAGRGARRRARERGLGRMPGRTPGAI